MATRPDSASYSDLAALILAAGKGTRMKSAVPKVLHRAAGRSLLDWSLKIAKDTGAGSACVVLSEDLTGFEGFLEAHPDLAVAIQKNRQGTGDAVAAAAWSFVGVEPAPYAAGKALRGDPIDCGHVLILAGDVPAIQAETLKAFVADVRANGAHVGVLGMRIPEPKGYGRMVVRGRELLSIVEDKDADAATKAIDVCNTGVILAEKSALFGLLGHLKPANAQREYYLTDIVRIARERGLKTLAHVSDAWRDFGGINDRAQLAAQEAWMIERKLSSLMAQGVTCRMPATLYVEPDVEVEAETEIQAGAYISGKSRIGKGCLIGSGVRLSDVTIGAGAEIGSGSVLIQCSIPAGERVPALSVRTR